MHPLQQIGRWCSQPAAYNQKAFLFRPQIHSQKLSFQDLTEYQTFSQNIDG